LARSAARSSECSCVPIFNRISNRCRIQCRGLRCCRRSIRHACEHDRFNPDATRPNGSRTRSLCMRDAQAQYAGAPRRACRGVAR
jgi:hypothetical protein